MAPPSFSLATLSNSQPVIVRFEIILAPIAPAVLLAKRFLNLELLIINFPSFLEKIAAAYFEVVFKKLELSTAKFDISRNIWPLIMLSLLLVNVELTTLTSDLKEVIEAPLSPLLSMNLQLLTFNTASRE